MTSHAPACLGMQSITDESAPLCYGLSSAGGATVCHLLVVMFAGFTRTAWSECMNGFVKTNLHVGYTQFSISADTRGR